MIGASHFSIQFNWKKIFSSTLYWCKEMFVITYHWTYHQFFLISVELTQWTTWRKFSSRKALGWLGLVPKIVLYHMELGHEQHFHTINKATYRQCQIFAILLIVDISRSNITCNWTQYNRKEAKTLFRLRSKIDTQQLALWTGCVASLTRFFLQKKIPQDIDSALYYPSVRRSCLACGLAA